MAAMKLWALLLSVLLAMTAPASAVFLGGNSPLGEKFPDGQSLPAERALSRASLPACNEACLRSAAEFSVAPSTLEGTKV